jgi:hypothetical protein
MASFLKKYSNAALNFLTILFLAVIVGYVAWAVDIFTAEARFAFALPQNPAPAVSFDFKGASALDLRGLTK